jgi:hypothetical protein
VCFDVIVGRVWSLLLGAGLYSVRQEQNCMLQDMPNIPRTPVITDRVRCNPFAEFDVCGVFAAGENERIYALQAAEQALKHM